MRRYSFEEDAAQSGGRSLHASDLPFFFNDAGEFDVASAFTPREAAVREAMQRSLLHFVAHGNPGVPGWGPVVGGTSSAVMVFGGGGGGGGGGVVHGWKRDKCLLWRQQRAETRHWLGDAELMHVLMNCTAAVAVN